MNKKIPKIAMGAWAWGDAGKFGNVFGNKMTAEDFKPIFDEAIKNGLNLWDTAAVYAMGESESILGKFVKNINRDDIIISTKFTPQIADVEVSAKEAVQKMIDDSKKRLNIDYADIYWIHNPADVEKWTPAVIPLAKSGQIKSIGVSNHNLTELKRASEILEKEGLKISAVQNHFSLLNRTSEKAGILEYCRRNNIIFYAYMVLEQGALSGNYDSNNLFPEGSARAKAYNDIMPYIENLIKKMCLLGVKHNASAAQIATAWAISKGTVPIIGVTKVKHVNDAAKATNIVLLPTEIEELETLAEKAEVNVIRDWEKAMD